MANMKLFFVLGAIFLCGVATVVRCEEWCFSGFTSLGCWKDSAPRAIRDLDMYLGDWGNSYKKRKDAINKCYKLATSRMLNVFGVQDGGQCFGSKSWSSYRKYGKAGNCKNGKGGGLANNVYRIERVRCAGPRGQPVKFTSLGCWKDTATRAIPLLDKYLGGGNYKARIDAINKCFKLATSRGLNVFGVQDGGQCFGSKSLTSYRKYGKAGNCQRGKGGGLANNVYRIIRGAVPTKSPDSSRKSLRCWKNNARTALLYLYDKRYVNTPKEMFLRCSRLANSGVQDGGIYRWCAGVCKYLKYKK